MAQQKMRYIQILFVYDFNIKDMTQLLVWNMTQKKLFFKWYCNTWLHYKTKLAFAIQQKAWFLTMQKAEPWVKID